MRIASPSGREVGDQAHPFYQRKDLLLAPEILAAPEILHGANHRFSSAQHRHEPALPYQALPELPQPKSSLLLPPLLLQGTLRFAP